MWNLNFFQIVESQQDCHGLAGENDLDEVGANAKLDQLAGIVLGMLPAGSCTTGFSVLAAGDVYVSKCVRPEGKENDSRQRCICRARITVLSRRQDLIQSRTGNDSELAEFDNARASAN